MNGTRFEGENKRIWTCIKRADGPRLRKRIIGNEQLAKYRLAYFPAWTKGPVGVYSKSAKMMQPILANAGVPMLFFQMPLLVVALPVVIAVEAWLCRRWLGVSWKQAWLSTSVANLLSTLAGFPILWIALVALQMFVGGGGVPHLAEPWYSVYTVTVQAAWLLPDEDRLYWMIPTAGMVLLIPAFFVTVLIEKWVYRRTFRESSCFADVTSATWQMHLVSYGLLFLAGFGLLVSSLVTHKGRQDGSANGRQPFISETNLASSPADFIESRGEMKFEANKRAGADATATILFAFGSHRPRTAQHGRSATAPQLRNETYL